MSTPNENDTFCRLSFLKSLQNITNKIHATDNIQQIKLDLSDAIRDQFHAEHLTLYVVSESKLAIETTIKTGLKSFKDFSLPISGSSIAGYVALTKKVINIRNAYDAEELDAYNPKLQFKSKVDSRTGFRTKEILASPIIKKETGELLGVLQLINTRNGDPFSEIFEEGITLICETLAIAFEQRLKPVSKIRTKYDHLISNGVISAPELALANSAARRKGVHLETTLVEEFQVNLADIGASLSRFFDVDYLAYQTNRPLPSTIKNFKRAFVERHEWLILEEKDNELLVLSTDPDNLIEAKILHNFFPHAQIKYAVCTYQEFLQTVEDFYKNVDPDQGNDDESLNEDFSLGVASVAEQELMSRIEKVIANAFSTAAVDIHIKQRFDLKKSTSLLRSNGSIQKISGQLRIDFHVNYPDTKANGES